MVIDYIGKRTDRDDKIELELKAKVRQSEIDIFNCKLQMEKLEDEAYRHKHELHRFQNKRKLLAWFFNAMSIKEIING